MVIHDFGYAARNFAAAFLAAFGSDDPSTAPSQNWCRLIILALSFARIFVEFSAFVAVREFLIEKCRRVQRLMQVSSTQKGAEKTLGNSSKPTRTHRNIAAYAASVAILFISSQSV